MLTQIKMLLLGFAEAIIALRIIPSVVVVAYTWFVWDVWQWFVSLPNPSSSQMGALTSVLGLAAAVFGFYVNGGNKFDWGRFDTVRNNVSQQLFSAKRTVNIKQNDTDKPVD